LSPSLFTKSFVFFTQLRATLFKMPSPSLTLASSTTLITAFLSFSANVIAAVRPGQVTSQSPQTHYVLDTSYTGTNFFDGFAFQTFADPTHGFVTYESESYASQHDLISFDNGRVQMRVDSTNQYNGDANYYNVAGVGRPSVRIESTSSWTHGLFIIDLVHMPSTNDGSGCGTWPAFWLLGSGTWPYNGEIDIIEGANNQVNDLTSAHTVR
jgi:beta-glucanase (GH16 family)